MQCHPVENRGAAQQQNRQYFDDIKQIQQSKFDKLEQKTAQMQLQIQSVDAQVKGLQLSLNVLLTARQVKGLQLSLNVLLTARRYNG